MCVVVILMSGKRLRRRKRLADRLSRGSWRRPDWRGHRSPNLSGVAAVSMAAVSMVAVPET